MRILKGVKRFQARGEGGSLVRCRITSKVGLSKVWPSSCPRLLAGSRGRRSRAWTSSAKRRKGWRWTSSRRVAAALLNRRHQQRRPPTLGSMTKVSKNGQTRTAESLNRREETNLLTITRAFPHPFEWAVCSGANGSEDHCDGTDGPDEPPPRVPLAELERRAQIKFSGITGAVVTSGGGPATTAPTHELARDVRKVILALPAVLFERSAKPRPCGLLCKLSAAGMLICDVLGLPLTPFELAEPVGKEAARLADKISAEVKKEKKKAGRRGMTAPRKRKRTSSAAASSSPCPRRRRSRQCGGGSTRRPRKRRCRHLLWHLVQHPLLRCPSPPVPHLRLP